MSKINEALLKEINGYAHNCVLQAIDKLKTARLSIEKKVVSRGGAYLHHAAVNSLKEYLQKKIGFQQQLQFKPRRSAKVVEGKLVDLFGKDASGRFVVGEVETGRRIANWSEKDNNFKNLRKYANNYKINLSKIYVVTTDETIWSFRHRLIMSHLQERAQKWGFKEIMLLYYDENNDRIVEY